MMMMMMSMIMIDNDKYGDYNHGRDADDEG